MSDYQGAVSDQSPLVYAVILTWNDTEMTRNCIRSLTESTYSNLRILLVDNGSKEPCGETIKAEFPQIELIVLPENKGFTGGANTGLKHALTFEPKYIFFLNNDTIIGNDAVTHLVNANEENPHLGMTSAMLMNPNEPIVQFYNATVDRNIAIHHHHNRWIHVDSREWPTIESEFVPACAILLRSEALEDVGMFDETFGTNWEDYDLCMRFQDKDWKIATVGDARVEHMVHQTTGAKSPYITYYFTRNRLICIKRYGTIGGVLRNSITIAKLFYGQVRDYGFNNWECHKSFVRAFWDFLIGKRGEDRKSRSTKG